MKPDGKVIKPVQALVELLYDVIKLPFNGLIGMSVRRNQPAFSKEGPVFDKGGLLNKK